MSLRPEVLAQHYQRAVNEATPKRFAVRPITGPRGQFQVVVFDPAAPEGEALPFLRWLASADDLRAFAACIVDAVEKGFTHFDEKGKRR